jgi:hypothetical protein
MALGSVHCREKKELIGGSERHQNSHKGGKYKAYRLACNNCTVLNVFRMGSSDSFTRKYCACAFIVFLVGIVLAVD